MKKLFEEYGGAILVFFVIVSLVATIGLIYKGDGTGWLEIAFQSQGITEKTDKSSESDIEVSATVYTLDFIENNEYLYAIGETAPEGVVAAFNMEFSEVFILANGRDNDGLMANMEISNSPMALNTETLKNAVIEDGVTNIGDNAFYGCSKLESITISSSVENISSTAFSLCSSLEKIYGADDSYAESFANENGYTFVAV